ncbi:hypothetical protein ABE196_18770 [Bacillus subtilis]
MFLDGKYLKNEKEINAAKNELFGSQSFKNLVAQLQELIPFVKEDLKFSKGYVFDTQSFEDNSKGSIVTGRIITFGANDKVQITNTLIWNKNSETLVDSFVVNLKVKDEVQDFYFTNDTLVALGTQAIEDPENKESETLPDNIDFVPFNTVVSQASFCLLGYNHCGPNCGDGLKYGGGPASNPVDACCRAHDRCWKNFGSHDACCDAKILKCVRPYQVAYPYAFNMITGWFAYNASKCKK